MLTLSADEIDALHSSRLEDFVRPAHSNLHLIFVLDKSKAMEETFSKMVCILVLPFLILE